MTVRKLRVGLSTIPPLGKGLYSNAGAVLSEMVANAYDADATCVRITTSTTSITIEDNGSGMSSKEIDQQYLTIGYQKRRKKSKKLDEAATRSPIYNRKVMGRKGIGKLAAFGIARIFEVHTKKEGIADAFRFDRDLLDKAIDRNDAEFILQSITPNLSIDEHGTKIVITSFVHGVSTNEQDIRTQIARRFIDLGIEPDFSVIVNGVPITSRDRTYYERVQLLWYIGSESLIYEERAKSAINTYSLPNLIQPAGYRIRGWIGSTTKPGDIDRGHHTLSIYAHKKLVQEDILRELDNGEVYMDYLVGEIEADFLDMDNREDIVTSDRQNLNENDERYKILRDFILTEIVNPVGRKWNAFRKEMREKRKSGSENTTNQASTTPLDNNNNSDGLLSPSVSTVDNNKIRISDTVNVTTNQNNEPEVIPEPDTPPQREIPRIFYQIRKLIQNLPIEKPLKTIALYDMSQAAYAYRSGLYKACIIMVGATLEGVMYGILRLPPVVEALLRDGSKIDQFKTHQMGGAQNPKYQNRDVFRQALSKWSFQDYVEMMRQYVKTFRDIQDIVTIQTMRNIVHPSVVLREHPHYNQIKSTDALHCITLLHNVIEDIATWDPDTA